MVDEKKCIIDQLDYYMQDLRRDLILLSTYINTTVKTERCHELMENAWSEFIFAEGLIEAIKEEKDIFKGAIVDFLDKNYNKKNVINFKLKSEELKKAKRK